VRGAARRRLAVGLLALLPALAGCRFTQSLSVREVVVHFAPTASQAVHLAAERHCHGYPGVVPEPFKYSKLPSSQAFDVRYRVDRASDYELNRLYVCLSAQPGVVGVDMPDLSQQ
jgi:hypothetical protein